MTDQWDYQIRIYLDDAHAEAARRGADHPALATLRDVLARHGAAMKCQYDAFADYVAEAEREGTDSHPLYAWTKATIEDPVKREKYLKVFSLYVDGAEVYPKAAAEALEAELEPLVGDGVLTALSKHDSNPANNPQPPAAYRG